MRELVMFLDGIDLLLSLDVLSDLFEAIDVFHQSLHFFGEETPNLVFDFRINILLKFEL